MNLTTKLSLKKLTQGQIKTLHTKVTDFKQNTVPYRIGETLFWKSNGWMYNF